MRETKITNAVLYSIWKGRFDRYEGEAVVTNYTYDDGRPPRVYTQFLQNGKRIFTCGAQSGIAYNKTVWLEERNDELARQVLIEYEKARIDSLQKKISGHKLIITMLEEAL